MNAKAKITLSQIIGVLATAGAIASQIQDLNLHLPHWALITLAFIIWLSHSPLAKAAAS